MDIFAMNINQFMNELTQWFDFSVRMMNHHPVITVTVTLVSTGGDYNSVSLPATATLSVSDPARWLDFDPVKPEVQFSTSRYVNSSASLATAVTRACGASRSASWKAGLKAATPTCSSSSAVSAVITRIWTTGRSLPGFS